MVATGKESAIKRQVLRDPPMAHHQPMARAKTQETAAAQPQVPRGRDFHSLVVGLPTQILRGALKR
ncbi:hypothetical protein SDC9_206043 [bioreactor metagenome]|uniref:Uncharacterized protein n=1 Tax=bioreactor metagenome TaxID=1076179 RepID=A0A645J6L2_9ZZZZ